MHVNRGMGDRGLCHLGLLGFGLILCGCPNPNTYTVPRTLGEGETQFTVAPEGFAYHYQPSGGSVWGATPTGPTLGFRYGVSDRIDVGARLSSLFSPTVDGKLQVIRGVVDVALDPGAQLLYVLVRQDPAHPNLAWNAAVLELYGPVLVGFNLSSSLTLVASPGIGYAFATPQVASDNNATTAAQAVGFMARLGLGVDIRTSERFALHPEVTLMRVFDAPQTVLAVVGLGFNIGGMPDYSDLDATK